MLKIRRPLGRLIFNMGIAIPGKTVFLIETAPCLFWMNWLQFGLAWFCLHISCQYTYYMSPLTSRLQFCFPGIIDPIHKSHKAPVPYPILLYSEQKCAHFCSEWSILRYETGAFWNLWNWSIVLMSMNSTWRIPLNPPTDSWLIMNTIFNRWIVLITLKKRRN